MTNEEKQLLLKDLCGRLPYGFKYQVQYGDTSVRDIKKFILDGEYSLFDTWMVQEIKPYLRPMSSMTEEEMAVLLVELCVCKKDIQNCGHTEIYGYTLVFQEWEKKTFFIPSGAMDYLNAHHLDYRGLIKKGMALEAPDGMYDIK